jgi:two-component system chemotaxis response regulator CheY
LIYAQVSVKGGHFMTVQDLKILICDDSMFARKKLNMTVTGFGVKEIYEAADGEEAVQKYFEHKPDVVFMDIVMPKVTGLDALKQIIEKDPDAKVIMASSVGTQGHLKEALKAGAADFLQKPIADEDARKVLENAAKGVL